MSPDSKLFGEDNIGGGGDVIQFIVRLFADDNQHYKKKKRCVIVVSLGIRVWLLFQYESFASLSTVTSSTDAMMIVSFCFIAHVTFHCRLTITVDATAMFVKCKWCNETAISNNNIFVVNANFLRK